MYEFTRGTYIHDHDDQYNFDNCACAVEWSTGEAVRPHDIYACYNCPETIWPYCKYRKRAKFMSNLDQWTQCPRICALAHVLVRVFL